MTVEGAGSTVPPALGPGDTDPRSAARTGGVPPAVRPPLGPGEADPRAKTGTAATVRGPLGPGETPEGTVPAPVMTVTPALKPGDLVGPEPEYESVVFPPAGPGGTARFPRPVRRLKPIASKES